MFFYFMAHYLVCHDIDILKNRLFPKDENSIYHFMYISYSSF